ncbi:MAG: type I phosphomannose isomerase catalytic subunit [Planctomycetota bacterium]
MNVAYPLRFKPILRRYLWGGRRLETVLGKPLPPGNDYAESWELADHGADQSVVTSGPLSGTTLHELVRQHGSALLGPHAPQPQFPLLFKFLDAQKPLSVQVHPNDEQAARLTPPDRGKTEAWVVLHAEPGSRIYAGLKTGVDRRTLRDAIVAGTAEHCLHCVEPSVGDCLLIRAGTVHALGAGLVIAEIQQSSDTTYRLYDWNRVGPDGQPRQLHVEQALAVIDFDAGPVSVRSAHSTPAGRVQRLVTCDKFLVDRWQLEASHSIAGDQRCHVLVPLQGSLDLERDAGPSALRPGQTTLVPAAAGPLGVSPRGSVTLLDIYLPLS